ncbi:proteasome subunit alpha [Rhizohabitans arisaemae]|uniref:proteasome subunit alpha n=1 Tax=Rhizohabitans arisaemae TaxID=2720610 RepID=UPI0024B12F44|nr:proteasome subunit alpha [Rhizohabitans arisaemae]
MPFGYVSPEQEMRDKADFARKGIARGRSVVVLQYDDGILFVAPNPSRTMHKISEIYDRIGFAAVGKYNEFENLRLGGIRYADINGYNYDRTDVTARGLANLYTQTLGMIFTEARKPYEVEVVVAEVGDTADGDQIYRLSFDGSVADETGFVAIGGQVDQVAGRLKEHFRVGMQVHEALGAALKALTEPGGDDIPASQLEVAVLDRRREHRKFRRVGGARLEQLLAQVRAPAAPPPTASEAPPTAPTPPPTTTDDGEPLTAPEGDIDTG